MHPILPINSVLVADVTNPLTHGIRITVGIGPPTHSPQTTDHRPETVSPVQSVLQSQSQAVSTSEHKSVIYSPRRNMCETRSFTSLFEHRS